MAGERLRAIGDGAVVAIAGELTRAPRPSPDNLRRYAAAVQWLAARMPAMLPARYGTCFESADELTFVLRSRGRAMQKALARVRNRRQMTVRVVGPAQAGRHAQRDGRHAQRDGRHLQGEGRHAQREYVASGFSRTAASRRPTVGLSGADYLRGLAADAAREREVPGFEPVRAAVRRWVRDERVEKKSGVASVYHLVPRGSVIAYRRAVERTAASAGLQVVVSGPWPPYAFAEL